MIVVADSSPLHYLILVEQVGLLRQLYSEVVIPEAVFAELTRPASPAVVSGWLSAAPSWLRVIPVSAEEIAAVTESLDAGERAAIALAETMRADLLLIDEAAGRREANRRHIRVTGTLGVLRSAAEKGLIDVPEVLRRLQATNFYVDDELIESEFGRWLRA
jgi:predicted nucleic acid-binding protein